VDAEPDAAHRGCGAFPHLFQSNNSHKSKISDKYNHGEFKGMSNFDSLPAKSWSLPDLDNSPGDNNSGHGAACSIWPGNSSWLLIRPEFS
jgi:hypothetical protein